MRRTAHALVTALGLTALAFAAGCGGGSSAGSGQPDSVEPPDTVAPDTAPEDTGPAPDTAPGDTAEPDTVAPDTAPADTGAPDTSKPANHPPSISAVKLVPDTVRAATTLTCIWQGFADADGDADASWITWRVNGVDKGAQPQLQGAFVGGDEVVCEVTPYDGHAPGLPRTASTVVLNTPPAAAGVVITPAAPKAGDALTCGADGFADPDGDDDLSTVAWRVDGADAGSGPVLPGGHPGGSVVECRLTPFDGEEQGAPVTGAVVIQNSAPTLASAWLDPAVPRVGDAITCRWSGFSDPDGDADASTVAWDVNGKAAGTGPALTGGFARGDQVRCTVTPSDGKAAGAPLVATGLVGNAPPFVAEVTMTPAAPVGGETLTCAWSGYSDPDGDPDLSSASWTVNGKQVGVGSTYAGDVAHGDVVACTVVPFDGFAQGPPATHVATVGNAPPTLAAVTITPDPAKATQTLTCSWSGYADADGDPDESIAAWYVNGKLVAFGKKLGKGVTAGDVVACHVTPWDGHTEGEVMTAQVVIDNSTPNVSGVAITPVDAQVGDTLTCGYADFNDPDGDDDASTLAWLVNGEPAGDGPELGAGFGVGDEVTCLVTAHDGKAAGVVSEATLVIGNSAPSITAAVLQPVPAFAADTLTCQGHGFTDADGDPDLSKITWRINGVIVGAKTALAGGYAAGDIVSCEVTPFDGKSTGLPMAAKVVVSNTPPGIEAATISPALPRAGDKLTCAWAGFEDPDEQPDLSTVTWKKNGEVVAEGKTWKGAYVADDTLTCVVTPYDGVAQGEHVQTSVVAANSAPTVTGLSVTPAEPQAGDTVSCAVMGYQDADGHADASTYAWKVNGAAAGTGGSLTGDFAFGDQITCVATPHDGRDAGLALDATVTVANTPPTVEAVTISPKIPRRDSVLTCAWSGYSDADGQPDESSPTWRVNGVVAGLGPNLSGAFAYGDSVSCTVLPFDGFDAGPPAVAAVTIANSPPAVGSVAINPASPTTADAITCSWADFSDLDGHPDKSSIAWLVNGAPAGQGPLLNADLAPDDTVTCTVTPSDGLADGEPISAFVTVKPAPATVTSVTITPAQPKVADTLTCAGESQAEVDGMDVQLAYAWKVNGKQVGTGSTLAGAFERGNVVSCTVTPLVGPTVGTPMTESVTVVNSPPKVVSVGVSPAAPKTNDVVTASATGSDPDGDGVTFTFEWLVDGVPTGVTGPTLDGKVHFSRDQAVTVRATPKDPFASGPAKVSAAAVVANSAPSAPQVLLSEAQVNGWTTPLTCQVVAAGADPDGDALSTTFTWTLDGEPFPETGPAVPAAALARGQEWTCAATVADDQLGATSAPAFTRIGTAIASNVWLTESWDQTGSPYVLTQDISIGTDGVLTVKPGVEVFGQGHAIEVRGKLAAPDDVAFRVFHDVHVTAPVGGSAPEYIIQIEKVHFIGGSLHADPVSNAQIRLDQLDAKKCVFEGLEAPIVIIDPMTTCDLTENLYLWSPGIWLDLGDSGNAQIKFSTFFEWTGDYAIAKWSGRIGNASIQDNNFLATDRVAVRLPVGATEGLKARANWWGTTDPSVIASMVFDLADDPGSPDLVDWGSWLTAFQTKAPSTTGWVP